MKRRQFLRDTTLSLATLPYIHRNLAPEEVILGHNDHRYRLDRHWGDLNPHVIPVKDCHEMIQDKQGRIFLLTNETKNNVIIYNKDGKPIKTWGTTYPGAHGLTLSEEGGESFLYICDNNRHEVIKTTLDGREIMVLPYPAESGKYESADKYIPTETTIAPNGDIYVADGYGSQYIIHYDSQGKLKNVFGGRGPSPANFDNAHGIALDTRMPGEPTLLITARQQNKLKRFSLSGELIKEIPVPGAYICRPVIHGDYVYCATLISHLPWDSGSGFVTILDKNDQVVSVPGGSAPAYTNGQLDPLFQTVQAFKHPHDVCVDEDENLYIAQWNSDKVYPYKLTRVA